MGGAALACRGACDILEGGALPHQTGAPCLVSAATVEGNHTASQLAADSHIPVGEGRRDMHEAHRDGGPQGAPHTEQEHPASLGAPTRLLPLVQLRQRQELPPPLPVLHLALRAPCPA